MARLVLYALAALATRAYDWTTPGDALTPFDCDAYPNPIQVWQGERQSPPYNVSRYGLRAGRTITIGIGVGDKSPWPRIIRLDRGPDGKPCAGPNAARP